MTFRWFLSRTVRQATDLRRQVRVLLNSQRDLLGAKAITEVERGLQEFTAVLRAPGPGERLKSAMDKLETLATQWLQPFPHPSARENIKEFLVSGVLVLTVFNFFVQPMKIPSGSAQPTLYGNVTTDLKEGAQVRIPSWPGRVGDWFRGIDYHWWTTEDDGELRIEELPKLAGFITRLQFSVGRDSYTLWFPPDNLARFVGVLPGQPFRKGEEVLRFKVSSGDRLFVDRFTYNFRRPERGEVIVFTSTGIPRLIQNTHYIKRLVALSGEHVRIGDDRHLSIDGLRLDAATPHFENVYSFTGPPQESVYSGHVNDRVAAQCGKPGLAPLFPDQNTEYVVGPNRYLAFGDNTMNSFDGRSWGDFPREKVIGKACLVFWPLTSRFGLVTR